MEEERGGEKIFVISKTDSDTKKLRYRLTYNEKGDPIVHSAVQFLIDESNHNCDKIFLWDSPSNSFISAKNEEAIKTILQRQRIIRVELTSSNDNQCVATIKYKFFDQSGGNTFIFNDLKVFIQPDVDLNLPDDPHAATSSSLWDGSILLSRYLTRDVESEIMGKSVLELGAGLGLVSIVAHKVCAAKRVLATDLENAIPALKRNIEVNKNFCDQSYIECTELDWFEDDYPPFLEAEGVDFIVAADVIWVAGEIQECPGANMRRLCQSYLYLTLFNAPSRSFTELVDPFFDSVIDICNKREREKEQTKVILCYQRRGKESHEVFMKRLEDFKIETVPVNPFCHPADKDAENVFSIYRLVLI